MGDRFSMASRQISAGTNAQAIARAFVDARRAGVSLPAYPGDRPETLAAAYAIQDTALALWGDRRIGGWKVGSTVSKQIRHVLGFQWRCFCCRPWLAFEDP